MSEDQRILAQLLRLADAGYMRIPNRRGMAEHVAALADIPSNLLELAVSRWIKIARNKFFPFPGDLRAMVEDEIDRIVDAQRDYEHEGMRLELIAKGITWEGMPDITPDEARQMLLARRKLPVSGK
jgi:hypothetical protein